MTTLTITAAVAKALGHGGRLRLLAMLRDGPLSVCQMASVLEAPVSTVSGHLLELRRAALVVERRKGKWVYYGLADSPSVAGLLGPVLAAIADDPDVRQDAAKAAALRGTSPAALCEEAAVTTAPVLP